MKLPAPHHEPAFHAGERALQTTAGLAERMAQLGPQVIRTAMPAQHQAFFPILPFLLVGSIDATGQPSASVLAGPPGFVHAPDPQHLQIHAHPSADDPLARNLGPGAPLGLLGIQPHTRRRNRANGQVSACDAHGFTFAVSQSFGNCPKYIHPREATYLGPRTPGPAAEQPGLSPQARHLITHADTFFIASAHPDAGSAAPRRHGVDISHRGGQPGFIHINAPDTLTIPDYRGNFFFNTLGNLTLHPLAGLLFIDFHSGDLLQINARAEIVDDPNQVARHTGAERLLRLTVAQTLWRPSALALQWEDLARPPYLPALDSR